MTFEMRIRRASLMPFVALARMGLGSGLDDVTEEGDVIVVEVASFRCDSDIFRRRFRTSFSPVALLIDIERLTCFGVKVSPASSRCFRAA